MRKERVLEEGDECVASEEDEEEERCIADVPGDTARPSSGRRRGLIP